MSKKPQFIISIFIVSIALCIPKIVLGDGAQLKDETGIEYLSIGQSGVCKGDALSTFGPKKIQLPVGAFNKGINCEGADFDRNGYIDYVFSTDWNDKTGRQYEIVMYKGKQILHRQVIDDPRIGFLEVCAGCKTEDGHISYDMAEFGEGGEGYSNSIFIKYDPSTGTFKYK